MPVSLLPLGAVLKRMGSKKSGHYIAIKRGVMVHPIALSERTRRYPDSEIDAIIAARIAGKNDDEIRNLVKALEAARQGAA